MTVPVVHSDPAVREVVRRGVRNRRLQVVSCRGLDRVEKMLAERLIDGIVVDLRDVELEDLFTLRERFPSIPIFSHTALKPEDGRLILACGAAGVHILIAGVDDPIAGEYVSGRTAAAVRGEQLAGAPARLQLSESIQLRTWNEILARVGSVIRTGALARAVGISREHLSREFAAGDAPNLKRVIDLARVACAAQLLGNPGYSIEEVSRILGYSSASHLAATSSRVAGLRPARLAEVGPRGVLDRFCDGRTRSRL